MASSNIDFSDYNRIAPPFDEPPRQRGCMFYGCIIASVLSLLFLIAILVIGFLLWRWFGRFVNEYTATSPHQLPVVVMAEEQRAELRRRVEAFRAAVDAGRPTGPLVLSADDLNVLIDETPRPNLKGKVYVTIEQDKLKGQVSIPLSDIPSFGLTIGRYLNGEAEFNVHLEDGEPFVSIRSIEVNGRRPSDEFMRGLKGQNLIRNVQIETGQARIVRRLDSVQVRDGKLIVTAREAPAKSAGPSGTDVPAPAPDSGPASRTPQKTPEQPDVPPWLPEDDPAPSKATAGRPAGQPR